MLGRGGARGLPTMLPMMGARAPFGADFNPLWARKGPGAGPNSHLDQLRAETELRARFPALSNTLPNLDQLQALQEQAALMANLTKSPADVIADRNQEQMNLMAGNPLMQNPNSVLIAQLAAQMQRQMQQNMTNAQEPIAQPTHPDPTGPPKEVKSENNSRVTTPNADLTPALPPAEISEPVVNESEEKMEQITTASLPDAQIEEIDDNGDKISQKSGDDKVGDDQVGDKTSSLEASRDENALVETAVDPPEALEIVETDKNDENQNHQEIVVEPTSPVASTSAISEKSNKPEIAEDHSVLNPRKRKMEEPLDYSINEQLLQQRLQQRQGFFPFPLPNFQVILQHLLDGLTVKM